MPKYIPSVIKMQEKLKEILADSSLRRKIFILLAVLGIIIVFLSSNTFSSSKKNEEQETTSFNYEAYTNTLEERLKNTISSIEGVGECNVMITLAKSGESVYAKDSESKTDDSSQSREDNYVIYDSEDGESPLLIDEYFPEVQGVAVVCSGGGDSAVREKIIETVSSLFGIPTNRISVSKIKE